MSAPTTKHVPKANKKIHDRFVAEYLKDLNATQAYLRAMSRRVKETSAATEGWRLLRMPEIQAKIAAGQRKRAEKAELSAVRVLEELRRLAFYDPADFFDADGSVRAIHEMSPEARACIAGLEIARANFDRTDGKKSEEWLHKIKLQSKDRAIEMLAKHFKLLTDVIEVRDDSRLHAALNEGRAKSAAARNQRKGQ